MRKKFYLKLTLLLLILSYIAVNLTIEDAYKYESLFYILAATNVLFLLFTS